MTSGERVILITGITGKQGGAAARELAGKGFQLRGLTRKPGSVAARALANQGVQIIEGDLDSESSLARALDGAWGVFAVQNTWEAGVEGEEEQGKRLAALARKKGVQHFVYASVASAHRATGIPHFENKWRVEEAVRSLKFPSYVIIRPVFFMENLFTPWFLNGDKLVTALDPRTSLQMIAVEDIGRYHTRAFTHATEMNGAALDIAGDSLTMPAAAEALSRSLGRGIEYVRIPIEEVRKNSEDLALMLEWFDRVGYNADIDGNARKYGIRPTTLESWARKQAAAPSPAGR
jgi:uncharacterized protein YbjT (DUF2867 family)